MSADSRSALRQMARIPHALALGAAVMLLATVSPALAEKSAIVSGGPRGAARAKLVRALDGLAASDLQVCWRHRSKGAARVNVALTVGAKGRVTRSESKTPSALGQCVAGVLSVQSLPRTAKGYRVVASLGRWRAAAGSRRTAATIDEDLGLFRPYLQRCFESAPNARAGDVVLRFMIKANGRIVDPVVAQSTIADASAERCMLNVLRRARLRTIKSGTAVNYSLSMALQTRAESPIQRDAAALGYAPKPKKDGPIPSAVLSKVMKRAMPRFKRCSRRGKKPGRSGNVILRFTIRANGTTRNVKVRSSTLKDAAVESCLIAAATKVRFPAQAGRAKTRVFYPFVFGPTNQQHR